MNDMKHRGYTAHRRPRTIALNRTRIRILGFAVAWILLGVFALGYACGRLV